MGRAWYRARMAGVARTRGRGSGFVSDRLAPSSGGTLPVPVVRSLVAGLLCALGALWIASPGTAAAACPPIENKPAADSARAVRGHPASDLLPARDRAAGAEHHPAERVGPLPASARVHHQIRSRARLYRRHGPARGRGPPPPRGVGGERESAVRGRRGEDDHPGAEGIRLAVGPLGQLAPQRHAPRPGRNAGEPEHRVEDRLRSRHVSRCRIHPEGAHTVDGRLRTKPASGDLELDLPGVRRLAEDGPGRPLHLPRPGHRRPARPHRSLRSRGRPTTR